MTNNSTLPYGWMLSGALAFAVMAALAHALGPRCDWQVVATARTGLALVFAVTLAWLGGARLVMFRPRTLWLRSIAGSVSLVCTFYALPRLPVADVLTLTNVFPLWVALLSWPLLGETPPWQVWVAIGVGLAGVVLVEQPHFVDDSTQTALPAAMALAASVSTAIAMLGLHRLHAVDPRAIVAHFSGVALVVCLASLAVSGNQAWARSQFDEFSLAMLLGVGVCATIGQLFLTKAFAAGPPAKVSVVALSQVAFAAAFDSFVEGHSFSMMTMTGMALVIAPTAWLLVGQDSSAGGDL